jgi:hypothetical protein
MAVAAEEFQVWKLAVRPDRSATLTCDDGNGNIMFTKEIKYTDFPLDEITLYFATIRVPPVIPYSRERKQFPISDLKAIRLLLLPGFLPLVETICGNQAPAEFQRIAERGLCSCRFRSCVNHLGGTRRLFRPRRNQSPTK